MFDEQLRGIGKAAIAQYRALATLKPTWEFHLFHAEEATHEPFADLRNVRVVRITIPGDRFRLWPRLRLPWAIRRVRADLFHAPAGIAPWWLPVPMIATVHDLIPWETNRTDPPALRWIADVRRTLKRARHILADSEFTRGRIAVFCGRTENVHVVPLAAITTPPSPPSDARRRALMEKYSLDAGSQGYVLHFGMADPRKGTAVLLRAWALLPTELRKVYALRIVGLSASARADFEGQARKLNLGDQNGFGDVRFFEYVAEDDARDLLGCAAVLAYPTSLEGFGLPLLDAFAAAVPVLGGNRASLPEVAGDAAILVDPEDPRAIADGLCRLLSAPSLRAECVVRGRIRSAEFSWAKTAERTAEVMAWNSFEPIREDR